MTLNAQKPARAILKLLAPSKWRIALAVLTFTVKHSPVWLLPILTANIIDVVVGHRPLAQLWINAAILSVVLLQNVPTHVAWVRLSSKVVRRIGVDLRSALTQRMQQLSIGYHTKAGSSRLQNKVVRDVENVELMLQQTAEAGTSAVVTLVSALLMTALRVPQFVPLFLLVVPCAAVLVSIVRKRAAIRNEQFRTRVEQLSARVGEMTHLMPITRAHGLEKTALRRIGGSVQDVGEAGLRLDMVNGRLGAMSWVTYQMLGAACLVAAAWAAWSGAVPVSAGDVVLLSSYFALLTSSVVMLFGLAPIITKGLESVRSIGEVLQAQDLEDNEGKTVLKEVEGAFELRGVTLVFPDGETTGLSGLDLSVRPGETIAIVGPSGAGKSTLLSLLLGFTRPTSGQVLLDGQSLQDIDLRTYRSFVSVVPQDSLLFDGSVLENVTYGLETVAPETVEQALRDANAWDFVAELPEGWHTRLGERGARLSGGQRQRLAIARALVRNPRVLLLDEATSALDSASETQVQQALSRLMKGRTTFVVAHRLSTIRTADELLTRTGGLYARMHAAQAA